MVPFRVKLSYRGSAWKSIILEVGHDELGDTNDSELRMDPGIIELFTSVGLPAPSPVALLSPKHQIAQKLHAASSKLAGNERAHDLVDLQLLDANETYDLAEVRDTCERLFRFRKAQAWPPTIVEYQNWDTIYQGQANGVSVIQDVGQAIVWANCFIERISNA